MAPFLRDEGPPVSASTIQEARSSLAPEYGYRVVRENGRAVLLVRSPRAKPDYLHELEEVALYVTLDEVKDVKDVLLLGTEKICRLEPLLLRDHIRTRVAEDRTAAENLVRSLEREYGYTLYKHPETAGRTSIAVRIPRASVSEVTPDDVKAIRQRLKEVSRDSLAATTAAYLVADSNYERLGRRVFFELVDPELAKLAPPPPASGFVPRPVDSPTMVAASSHSAPAAHFVPSGGASSGAGSGGPFGSLMGGPPAAPAAPAARPVAPPKEMVSSDANVEVYVRKPPTRPAVAAPAGPPADNGTSYEPVVSSPPPAPVAPASPPEEAEEDAVSHLAGRLAILGYEAVAGVTVLGTTFDLAAHHKTGKRLLVKHVPDLAPDDVKGFEKIARSVMADACVLVVDEVTPALRLAAWGTTVEIATPADARRMLG